VLFLDGSTLPNQPLSNRKWTGEERPRNMPQSVRQLTFIGT
jgi:hypothetical protein